MNLGLKDKVFIVTGGSKGIGEAITKAIVAESGKVVIATRSREATDALVSAIASEGGEAFGIIGDLQTTEQCNHVISETVKRLGRIDGVINNAGFNDGAGLNDGPEAFRKSIEVNLFHYYDLVHYALPYLKESKGSIINIGSDVGVISPDHRIYQADDRGYEGVDFNIPAFYAVAKAGVIHLTKYLATLWAPYNVRVNAFSPAGVYRDHDPGFVAQLASRIPMGRLGQPEDCAKVIEFLATDLSDFVTGQVISVDGGMGHLNPYYLGNAY